MNPAVRFEASLQGPGHAYHRKLRAPAYRDALRRYLQAAPMGHIRHHLRHCFDMHLNYLERGAMLPDLNVAQFGPHHVPVADKD